VGFLQVPRREVTLMLLVDVVSAVLNFVAALFNGQDWA
jgi:hypothetical protein